MKHRIEATLRLERPRPEPRQPLWSRRPDRVKRRLSATVAAGVLLALATLGTSCAYYNTFFFARRYYNQAVRSSRVPVRSGPGGSSQSTGVTGQVSSLLDKSIEKCAKVITFYPRSKWVDDAIYLMGQCYYLKQDYDRALKKFGELPVYYPKSEYVPKSMFMVGLCAYGKKEYDQTIQVLQKALVEHPRAGQRERTGAMFTLGEAFWQKKEYADALVNYRLLAGGKKSEFYFKSLLKAGQCYFELARYDSARMCFSSVVRQDDNDEEVLDALIRTGDSYAAEKSLDSATRSYQEAMVLAEDFAKVPVVKLKMADVELAKENYEKAIELYRSVVTDFPRTPFASEAQFRMGYIYEVYLEDLDKAAQAYDKVKEHLTKSEFASQAELRGKGLARLRESGKKPGTSEVDKKAEPDFILAELSLFQLGKPDKAIEKYLTVERDFPKSVYAPKAAYAAAYAFLNMKQDTASAIATGRRVIEKFPNTEYAEAAGEILKSLNVDMSPELLQKTIPAEPAPADTQKTAAVPRSHVPAGAAGSDSLGAGTLMPADSLRAGTPMPADSLRAGADSLKSAAQGRGPAQADTLKAGRDSAGAVAPPLADSLRGGPAPVDSLKAPSPAGAPASADTAATPEPERPELLYLDEGKQDTSAAR